MSDEKGVLVLSEIGQPKFEIKLSPDAEVLSFDPFEVTQKVEEGMSAATDGESSTAKILNAIRGGFNLPNLPGNTCLALWGHLQEFVMELESSKKLSRLAGRNLLKPDANQAK